jgi:hypothetical protein
MTWPPACRQPGATHELGADLIGVLPWCWLQYLAGGSGSVLSSLATGCYCPVPGGSLRSNMASSSPSSHARSHRPSG